MKSINKITWVWVTFMAVYLFACNNKKEPRTGNNSEMEQVIYTCPMPQDSVFSHIPGKCPKCGMKLVLMKNQNVDSGHKVSDSSINKLKAYACPMHPQVQSDTAGSCPICGMQLESKIPVRAQCCFIKHFIEAG